MNTDRAHPIVMKHIGPQEDQFRDADKPEDPTLKPPFDEHHSYPPRADRKCPVQGFLRVGHFGR
jgi:hypothetical protein